MVTVILAEPEHPGNIGSVCRVMANFGFTDLVLINPKCAITQESKNLAKNAQTILAHAKTADWSVLKKYRVVAATTSDIGSDYNMQRTPLTPRQAAAKLASVKGAAILFGRESTGLTNDELLHADFVVTIPTHKTYVSMNLSHAVAIMLYELFLLQPQKPFNPITPLEKRVLEQKVKALIKTLPFSTDTKNRAQEQLWKNIFGRALLTKREAYATLGFFAALERRHRQQPITATRKPVR